MLLDHALLTSPATPPALLAVVADRGVRPDLRGLLAAHPSLPAGLLDRHEVSVAALLRTSQSPHPLLGRLTHLLERASVHTQRDYVTADPDAPPQALVIHAAADRATHGHLTRTTARALTCHPATPQGLHLEALNRMLAVQVHTEADVPRLVDAATRHPARLTELAAAARDTHVARALTDLAARPDPAGSHITTLLASATREVDWSHLVRRVAGDPATAVTLARLSSRPLEFTLGSPLAPTPVKLAALRDWARRRTTQLLVGELLQKVGPLEPRMDDATAVALAATARSVWDLPRPFLLPGASRDTLEALWAAARRICPRGMPLVRQAEYALQVGCHPNADAALRAAAIRAVTDYGASPEADRTTWFQAGTALATLDSIEKNGFAATGLTLPVRLVRTTGWHMSMADAITHLAMAGLATSAAALAEPGVARAFDALTDTFPGTLADLVNTARTIAA